MPGAGGQAEDGDGDIGVALTVTIAGPGISADRPRIVALAVDAIAERTPA